ncbi:glycosyltransferase family 2 protein [Flavobacterium frigoris]|uniref:Glycosyl transferase family protein n=1 Tax=Flavobacterium frigoris (strain PS1) TaxID=1086011 RepID=H7FM82_FLAFP|nr:glycosyltransferase family A protein [Flavobacterium frigoris]EIA10420.1 glycosyl transferase family protein [Flavobacterium frigoris PS1]
MIKKSPKVTVVIPCFNDGNFIQETVNSVFKQTFQDFQVIIVDDGSNESTKEVLKALKNDRVNIITQNNRGPSSARNTGMKNANSEYILIIDSDDTFEVSFLEKAITILNENSDIGAVSSHCTVFINNDEVISEHRPKGGGISDFLFDNNSVSFALIRKKTWEEVGGYDEKMINGFEDWEFWIALTKKEWKVGMIPELLFNYRIKDENSVNQNAKLNYRESNLNYIYKKHHDVYVNHFSEMVDFLTNLAQRNKRNEIKYKNSIDYKIGRFILCPLRFIKKSLK